MGSLLESSQKVGLGGALCGDLSGVGLNWSPESVAKKPHELQWKESEAGGNIAKNGSKSKVAALDRGAGPNLMIAATGSQL